MRAGSPNASVTARDSVSCGIPDDIARVGGSKASSRSQNRPRRAASRARALLTGLGRLPIAPADPMTFEYIPVLAMIVLSALVPGLFLAVSVLFGPRRPSAGQGEAVRGGDL